LQKKSTAVLPQRSAAPLLSSPGRPHPVRLLGTQKKSGHWWPCLSPQPPSPDFSQPSSSSTAPPLGVFKYQPCSFFSRITAHSHSPLLLVLAQLSARHGRAPDLSSCAAMLSPWRARACPCAQLAGMSLPPATDSLSRAPPCARWSFSAPKMAAASPPPWCLSPGAPSSFVLLARAHCVPPKLLRLALCALFSCTPLSRRGFSLRGHQPSCSPRSILAARARESPTRGSPLPHAPGRCPWWPRSLCAALSPLSSLLLCCFPAEALVSHGRGSLTFLAPRPIAQSLVAPSRSFLPAWLRLPFSTRSRFPLFLTCTPFRVRARSVPSSPVDWFC
jgi:hypothetical protein